MLSVPCPGIEGLHCESSKKGWQGGVCVQKVISPTVKGDLESWMKAISVVCLPPRLRTWSFVFFIVLLFQGRKQHKQTCSGIRLTFFSCHYLAVLLCPLKYLFVQDQQKPLGKALVLWSVYCALFPQPWRDGVQLQVHVWNHSPALTVINFLHNKHGLAY